MWPLRRLITTQNVTNNDDGAVLLYSRMTEPFNERSEGGNGEQKRCMEVGVGEGCVRGVSGVNHNS